MPFSPPIQALFHLPHPEQILDQFVYPDGRVKVTTARMSAAWSAAAAQYLGEALGIPHMAHDGD